MPAATATSLSELRETWRITRLAAWRAVVEIYESEDLTFAASIAYYALLSLFPVLADQSSRFLAA